MDKVLGHLWQVIIDDVCDIIHVQATGGNISRHQYLKFTLLKSTERAISLRLRTIPVNHGRGKTFAG